MLADLALRLLSKVREVLTQDSGPDDVDLEHVDVAGTRSEQLLVERQALSCGIPGRDDLDRVAGLLRPGVDALLADLVFLAKRTARNGYLSGSGGRAKGEDQSGCGSGEPTHTSLLEFCTAMLASSLACLSGSTDTRQHDHHCCTPAQIVGKPWSDRCGEVTL